MQSRGISVIHRRVRPSQSFRELASPPKEAPPPCALTPRPPRPWQPLTRSLSTWTCPPRTLHTNGPHHPRPLCLASLTQPHVLGVHPPGSRCRLRSSLGLRRSPLDGQTASVYPLPISRHARLPAASDAAADTHARPWCEPVFRPSHVCAEEGTAGPHGDPMWDPDGLSDFSMVAAPSARTAFYNGCLGEPGGAAILLNSGTHGPAGSDPGWQVPLACPSLRMRVCEMGKSAPALPSSRGWMEPAGGAVRAASVCRGRPTNGVVSPPVGGGGCC